MKYLILMVLIPFNCFSQIAEGINFESCLTWTQIKAKAKKENKYIFVDCYTTWCAPCQMMNKEIFSQRIVSDFFNQNFLNVAVQFNKTKSDNANIKNWYKDAVTFQDDYKIDAYPTYLFFDANANLIHFIKGSSKNANDFLKKVQAALTPQTQYINLYRQYKEGKRDSLFLLALINTAQESGDNKEVTIFMNNFLNIYKNLLTEQNIKFIYKATTKISDIGFSILRTHPDIVDTIIGRGKSNELVKHIAFDEIVLPLIRKNGKKENYGGGMVIYSGETIPNISWLKVKEKLDINFPDLSEEIVLSSKPTYYSWVSDWANFTKSVSAYLFRNENKIDTVKLINYAQAIFFDCDELKYVEIAKNWVAKIIDLNDKTDPHLQIYCHLLYKAGNKDAAIKLMNTLFELSVSSKDELSNELEKMKKGEKIW